MIQIRENTIKCHEETHVGTFRMSVPIRRAIEDTKRKGTKEEV
jgi:hypothetical protein